MFGQQDQLERDLFVLVQPQIQSEAFSKVRHELYSWLLCDITPNDAGLTKNSFNPKCWK